MSGSPHRAPGGAVGVSDCASNTHATVFLHLNNGTHLDGRAAAGIGESD